MNIKSALENVLGEAGHLQLNNIDVDVESIRAIMINEIVPEDPAQDFYGENGNFIFPPLYLFLIKQVFP